MVEKEVTLLVSRKLAHCIKESEFMCIKEPEIMGNNDALREMMILYELKSWKLIFILYSMRIITHFQI